MARIVGTVDITGDDDSETIHVSNVRKRKASSPDIAAQKAKKPRVTGAAGRQTRLSFTPYGTIDLTFDDESEPRTKAAARPRKSPRKSAPPAATVPVHSEKRVVIRELNEAQAQNIERGPVAWCKLPVIDKRKAREFRRFSTSSTTFDENQAEHNNIDSSEDSLPQTRPQRTTRKSTIDISMLDASEDELLEVIPSATRRRSNVRSTSKTSSAKLAKQSRHVSNSRKDQIASEESDFKLSEEEEEDDDHSSSFGDSDPESNNNSDSTPDIDISEDDEPRKSKLKQAQAPKKFLKARDDTKASSKTKSKGKSEGRQHSANMVSLLNAAWSKSGLKTTLAPLSDISDIFHDLTEKAITLGLGKALRNLNGRPIRVATMCSGTESPLLALEMIAESLSKSTTTTSLNIKHLFSAEIVPFKQAYIERNFGPPIIFRDITELTKAVEDDVPMATTAYGAKVPIPTQVDMVIAGTSCVDFSRLNSRRKGLDDGGESADTWHAVLAYCRTYRPSFVLLENVLQAYWDKMLEDYQAIGYDSAGVLVDTKNYYLPQTRQRGYMVCFDKQKMNGLDSAVSAEAWTSLMERLQRPASAPVSSFLLSNDQITRQQFRNDERTREVDWSQCEMRHIEYRQDMRLGQARPITHWSESGAILPPDNGHAEWFANQVERVKDTIDCAILRKALPSKDMFDPRFKTRVLDLSQNVDREHDNRPFGTIGCITPTGQFYVSDSSRPMTSIELLKLQGLPLDKISFTTETPAEIQDLAGNAMSSPVIGAAIVSAIIAGHALLPRDEVPMAEPATSIAVQQPRLAKKSLSLVELDAATTSVDMTKIVELAQRTLRKCYCEGPKGRTLSPIQQCVDCGHTTCIVCGGNPAHTYQQTDTWDRALPQEFADLVRATLPTQIRFLFDESVLATLALPKQYGNAVREAVVADFGFHAIRRTHHWTVSYQAPSTTGGARLELVISDDQAEWRLYAFPDKSLAGNDPLRQMLQQPIATSNASVFHGGDWRIRVPKQRIQAISVSGSGAQIASFWCRNEFPDRPRHFLWEHLDVEVAGDDNELSGRYQYLPKCGTAFDGLYKKISNQERPVYLFMDPTRTGPAAEDGYVFSHEKEEHLEYDQVRPVLARIKAPWRPWSETAGIIKANTTASLVVEHSWQSLSSYFRLQPATAQLGVLGAGHFDHPVQCNEAVAISGCRVPLSSFRGTVADRANSVVDADFIARHTWIFECMRKGLPRAQWTTLDGRSELPRCEACTPLRLNLRWRLESDGAIVPYEDPQGAAEYEQAIKARPQAMFVQFNIEGETVQLSLGVNLASLMHRTGTRLTQSVSRWSGTSADGAYEWRFDTEEPSNFTFNPFKLCETRDIEPYTSDLGMSVDLFPKQQLALSWMRKQEQGANFTLEESEETSLPSLGWRAEVRAQSALTVRGGICADHPGFGKTITTLALIQSQFNDHDKTEIIRDLASRQKVTAPGLIPIQATLVVCPGLLVQQWTSEIKDKLRMRDGHILSANTVAELAKYTIEQFKDAQIIVVNRSILGSDVYAERLAAFAAVPGPATKSGRAYSQWLEFATRQIPGHLEILEGRGLEAFRRYAIETYKNNVQSDNLKAAIPSRRLRGQNYVDAKEKKSTSTSLKGAAKALDTANIRKPLLEMFFYNRIVFDEFHNSEPREYAAITALKADKRWALSGTPPIGDFYDIAQMAGLLGVPLRIGSDARGLMKLKNIRDLRKEMTDFERFDAMRQKPSHAMHSRLHEIDQRFLDVFVRQNVMDFEGSYKEHIVPVSLDLAHRALYHELSQHLNSLDMRIKKGRRSQNTSRQQRLNDAMLSSTTAEEALSKAAVFLFSESDEAAEEAKGLRSEEAKELLARLPYVIAQALLHEPKNFEKWQASQLEKKALGDDATIEQIQRAVKSVSKKANSALKLEKAQSPDDINTIKGTRAKTAALNGLCNRLLVANRSARYLNNVQKLPVPRVDACENAECEQHGNDSTTPIAVSGLCGHTICKICHQHRSERAIHKCPAQGCGAPMHDYQLLWSDQVSGTSAAARPHGAKIEAALDLLAEIEKRGDQAILFVHFDNQLDQLEEALSSRRISATVVRSTNTAGQQIADFRETAGTEEQTTVIVLNASAETAAGSNIQNANHVIFLSPLLRDTQYDYSATMAQAIGRARRHGQKKEIHVYRFVALHTIDVDILEHREKRIDALTEQDAEEVKRPDLDAEPQDEVRPERTQLVREHGRFSLRPQSWLIERNDGEGDVMVSGEKVRGKNRILGWEDFSSLIKFSKCYTENDD